MPSDVDIANLALTKLGQQRILSFTDNVKSARSLNAIYAMERDNEIRAHQWSFAMKRVLLPALVDVPAFGYNHAYQLPDDYLKLIQAGRFSPGGMGDVISPGSTRVLGLVVDGSDYRIEGSTIVTNFPAPLGIRYMRRVTDPNQFDACFVKAFASRLAMEMAEDLIQTANKRTLAQGEYKEAIIAAIRANAIELPPDPLPDNSWVIARLPG